MCLDVVGNHQVFVSYVPSVLGRNTLQDAQEIM